MNVLTYSIARHAARAAIASVLTERTIDAWTDDNLTAKVGVFTLRWLAAAYAGVSITNALKTRNEPTLSLSDGLMLDIGGKAMQAAMTMTIE